jgi:NAD-dependent DNA ligase
MTQCNCCNSHIEEERLELLPNTRVCSRCAQKGACQPQKMRGVMVWNHKTAPTIQVMSASTYESQKKYYTPNGARSAVKNFSKSICS